MMEKEQNNIPKSSKAERDIQKLTDLMIERMEQLRDKEWEQGWTGLYGTGALPQNINGRKYSGHNTFFLFLHTSMKGYEMPVYMTFNQIKDEELKLQKGAQSFPVVYWDVSIKDNEGKHVTPKEYENMSPEEKDQCHSMPFMKTYGVFNVDQTNLKEAKPEKYQALQEKFKIKEIAPDTNGMYVNEEADRMFEKQEWVCPIHIKTSDQAFYVPSADYIQLPKKEQFFNPEHKEHYQEGQEFYSTAFHEMAHSTGHESRLNRDNKSRFGDKKYAKEELVAELSAAIVSNTYGFDRQVTDNSAAYLNGWIKTMKEEPRFLVSVMAAVNSASEMILKKLDEQRIALGKEAKMASSPVTTEKKNKALDDETFNNMKMYGGHTIDNMQVYQTKKGPYKIRATVDGIQLPSKFMSQQDVKAYQEKTISKAQLVGKYFRQEIFKPKERKNSLSR